MNENLLDNSGDPSIDPEIESLAKLDPIELAKRKYESDKYIKTLESRQDEFRRQYTELEAKYNARAKLEELYDRTATLSSDNPVAKEVKAPEIDMTKIEGLVEQKIRATEKARLETANFEMVKTKLKERYGNNYQTHLQAQIEAEDLTQDDVNDMARKRPKALLKLLGLDVEPQRDPFQAPPKSTLNTFSPTAPKKRTWSYYQELKKTDPKAYMSRETTVQMHKDYEALGKEFEDGDFRRFKDGI